VPEVPSLPFDECRVAELTSRGLSCSALLESRLEAVPESKIPRDAPPALLCWSSALTRSPHRRFRLKAGLQRRTRSNPNFQPLSSTQVCSTNQPTLLGTDSNSKPWAIVNQHLEGINARKRSRHTGTKELKTTRCA
jgi:hypothetical protein